MIFHSNRDFTSVSNLVFCHEVGDRIDTGYRFLMVDWLQQKGSRLIKKTLSRFYPKPCGEYGSMAVCVYHAQSISILLEDWCSSRHGDLQPESRPTLHCRNGIQSNGISQAIDLTPELPGSTWREGGVKTIYIYIYIHIYIYGFSWDLNKGNGT